MFGVFMSKKIMFFIFIVNCILIVLLSYTIFSELSYRSITNGYKELVISGDREINTTDYANAFSDVCQSVESDVYFRKYNISFNGYDYYRTTSENNFQLGFINYNWNTDTIYSSQPLENEKRIYGFFNDIQIRILPLERQNNLFDSEKITAFVRYEYIEQFSKICSEYDLNCSYNNSAYIHNSYSEWKNTLMIFIMFLFISIIFYSFSCRKDTIIKKALGFTPIKIFTLQFKECFKPFLIICTFSLFTSFIFFTIKNDLISSALFNIIVISLLIVLIIISALFFAISFIYIASSAKIKHMKGNSNKKDFLNITECFRIIILCLLLSNISSLNLIKTITDLNQLKNSEVNYQDFLTFKAHNIQEYDLKYEEYAPKLLDAYNELCNSGLILVTRLSETSTSISEATTNTQYITVNNNYIDFCDNLIDTNGNKINSTTLKKGKINFLFPDKSNPSDFIKDRSHIFKPEDINIIYYNSSSDFDLLSNSTDGRRVKNIVLEVKDLNFYAQHESSRTIYEFLTAYFSNSVFMKYDPSFKIPYEQISPVLKKYNIDGLVFRAPLVCDEISETIAITKRYLLYNIFTSSLYLFAFFVLIVFSASLYCSCKLQDISLKLINGLSVLQIINTRLIINLALIPIIIFATNLPFINRFFGIDNSVIIAGVIAQTFIYYILVKYKSMKNLISLIKGA